ncbi:MAG: TIR domain-containing protein [Tissierellales bacterium]|nr:TIR domain-containing protein [Tissierellales bacterium]
MIYSAVYSILNEANQQNVISIDLSDEAITKLPSIIGNLKYLEKLDLSNNLLTSLPPQIGNLTSLIELNLSDNKINVLPAEITNLQNLERIDLTGNPLDIPPIEIANRGIKSIRNYFDDLKAAIKSIQLFEAKILVVGEGGVGKTTLTNALFNKNFVFDNQVDKTTEGIDIKKWAFKFKNDKNTTHKFTVNIWDFGGQEIYHTTHQFFLTRRSLYLFVWDARQEYHELSFYYWLNIIFLLSAQSPVIIVMNKKDVRERVIDEATLSEKFTNIVSFHKVSCATGEGILELKNKIRNTLLNLPHIGELLPKKWLDIKKILSNDKRNYITYNEYQKLCEKFSMNKNQAYHLSRYFHDLAGILNFQDNPLLKNSMILKPEWATHAVYDVLDTKAIQEKKGNFNFRELELIWNKKIYPISMHPHLLELMKKFELVFQLHNTQDFLVPEMLPGDRPNFQWNDEDNLIFEYHYDFMPKGIITRFIVINHNLIENELFWKNGVILKKENTRARVICDQYNRKISISIFGIYAKEFLAIIRNQFEYINASLNHPSLQEMIPCNCSQCKHDLKPIYFNYEYLLKRREKNKSTIDCPKSIKEISIESLLSGIQIEKKPPQNEYDVFISYSSKDFAIIQEIVIDFKIKGISYWWDEEQIEPGDIISKKIEEGLNNSRNILLCLSYNQLESGWSYIEYTSILNKIITHTTNKKIIPLIIDNFAIEDIPPLLSNFKYTFKSDIKEFNKILSFLKKKL